MKPWLALLGVLAIPPGFLCLSLLIGVTVSGVRDWLGDVRRVTPACGLLDFAMWSGAWVPKETLTLGPGVTVRIYSGMEAFDRQLAYSVFAGKDEVIDGTQWVGYFERDRDEWPAKQPRDLHFSIVPSVDSSLVGVVDEAYPSVFLIAYDFRTGLSWPYDRSSGRIEHHPDDGDGPCIHRNRNVERWEQLILRRFQVQNPSRGYSFLSPEPQTVRGALRLRDR